MYDKHHYMTQSTNAIIYISTRSRWEDDIYKKRLQKNFYIVNICQRLPNYRCIKCKVVCQTCFVAFLPYHIPVHIFQGRECQIPYSTFDKITHDLKLKFDTFCLQEIYFYDMNMYTCYMC